MREPFQRSDEHDPGGKTRIKVAPEIYSEALFSDCGIYRYTLLRQWEKRLPLVLWVLMNPSVADHTVNDPTVAKCCRFARAWGYGGVMVGNVCAYRATEKRRLLIPDDPVGPRNRAALRFMAGRADLIIIAHGTLPTTALRDHARATVLDLHDRGFRLNVLHLSRDFQPVHPLYIREDTRPIPWVPYQAAQDEEIFNAEKLSDSRLS